MYPILRPAEQVPNFSHIFVIVFENKEFDQVIGNYRTPYLKSLAAEYGLATQFFATTHPSLPNYLAMLSGSTQGITQNCIRCWIDAPNLADQIEAKGLRWRGIWNQCPRPALSETTQIPPAPSTYNDTIPLFTLTAFAIIPHAVRIFFR